MKVSIPIDEVLSTDRCQLRYPTEADFPHIWSASRVAGFNDGMAWDAPEHMDELQGPLKRNQAAWSAGTAFSWTIETNKHHRFVGRISIRRGDHEGEWSIGFWVHPLEQGNGYATEAAKAIIKFGFLTLGADVISAAHATWNTASQYVIERSGMRFRSMVSQGFMKHGKWVEEREYAVLHSEYTAEQGVPEDI